MKSRSIKFTLFASTSVLGALCLFCLWGAVSNYWTYFRMRSLPVEVVASTLVIDEIYNLDPQYPPQFGFSLSLDLNATGINTRFLHIHEPLNHAANPQEATDELVYWSPGSRHTVYLIRGDAHEARVPGGSEFREQTAGNGYLFGAFFSALFAAVLVAQLSDSASVLQGSALLRYLSVSTVFYGFSAMFWVLTILFLWDTIPKLLFGPNTTAAVSLLPPSSYPPESFPGQVSITPGGRGHLDNYGLKPVRLLTFTWQGRTIHAGLGGDNSQLDRSCPETATTCQFHVNPDDRWDVEPAHRWDSSFFAPLFLLVLFGGGLGAFGRAVRE